MEKVYKQYFRRILKKYRQGTATKEEIKFLESYYDIFELNDDLISEENEPDHEQIKYAIKATADERIDRYNTKPAGWIRPIGVRYAAAAVILIVVSAAFFFIVKPGANKKELSARAAQHILPGGNKAILTLANGSSIILNDAQKGEIAKQSDISVTKTADNQIVYKAGSKVSGDNNAAQMLNTISTPNGGQYQLVLPDGTKVFLNAASWLKYPAVFTGAERVVELNGEAYFEVAHNKRMPFIVKSGGQTVEVLGTHFNINCYDNEPAIKTTLLEGSVRVTSGSNTAVIVPGQQAIVNGTARGDILKRMADVDKELAWKNGLFSFENDDLQTVMRQISRWYNVKIVYGGSIPDEKFFGEISRNSNLAEVFKILELNNIQFDVDDKTVTVSYNKDAAASK